jgi:hypothetical protein
MNSSVMLAMNTQIFRVRHPTVSYTNAYFTMRMLSPDAICKTYISSAFFRPDLWWCLAWRCSDAPVSPDMAPPVSSSQWWDCYRSPWSVFTTLLISFNCSTINSNVVFILKPTSDTNWNSSGLFSKGSVQDGFYYIQIWTIYNWLQLTAL